MISILIPVYNRDVNLLASTLSRQLTAMNKPGEIILLDDGSDDDYRKLNAATAALPHVKYMEANANHGRIKIRQMLAEKAAYTWLLFLDCDSAVISVQYLENYYREVLPSPGLVVGGRIYAQKIPADCSLRLHWKYGTKRESVHKAGFMSNNFMIHRVVFDQLQFIDDWQGYGHEDTWIGVQLEREGVKIKFIDNVVVHEGLETSISMMEKNEQALQNLKKLSSLVPAEQLKKHVKLFRFFLRLKSSGLLWLPKMIYGMLRKNILKNLHSCHPSLFYFDLYRLNRFIEITHST
jgi:glycosyltransferase involved in cell wall biosynthesis